MSTRDRIREDDDRPAPPPFWHRLNSFFAFPFQMRPLMYGLALALCSLLFEAVFFLPDVLAILLIELGIVLAASRYGFKVVALGSRGIWRSADFPRTLDDEWVNLPWKLFAISLVQGIAIGALAKLDPMLATVGVFVMSFTFPAAVIVLVQSCSFFQAMNPGYVWETMRRQYNLRDVQIHSLMDKILDENDEEDVEVIFLLDSYDEMRPEFRNKNLFTTNNLGSKHCLHPAI